MQKEMGVLLTQIKFPEDVRQSFEDVKIERVQIFKSTQQMQFSFTFPHVMAVGLFSQFIKLVDITFTTLPTFKSVRYEVTYVTQPTREDFKQYFPYVVDQICKDMPFAKALLSMDHQFEGGKLSVFVADAQTKVEMERDYAQLIMDTYVQLGFSIQSVQGIVTTHAKSDEQLMAEKESRLGVTKPAEKKAETLVTMHQEMPTSSPVVTPKGRHADQFKNGQRRRKGPVLKADGFGSEPIADPILCHEIVVEGDEVRDVVMEGYIFDSEIRDIKTKDGREFTIFEAKFTDYSDSMYVSLFLRGDDMRTHVPKILGKGNWVRIGGKVKHDDFKKEVTMSVENAKLIDSPRTEERLDTAKEKRVELHLHTKMSAMDGVTHISDYIKTAAKWGHQALALTDHGVVQAIPEAFLAAKKHGIKMIYGVEANFVEDQPLIGWNDQAIDLAAATYIVYDVETTGFSTTYDDIIEIAAVKVRRGALIDEFSEFVNPHRKLSAITTKLTGIEQSDVDGARHIGPVMTDFHSWMGDAILVAHNADFDMGHLEANFEKLGLPKPINPVIDTLALARVMYHAELGIYWNYATSEAVDEKFKRKMKMFNLKALARFFNVDLTQHHRAIYDARATAEAFIGMMNDVAKLEVKTHDQLNTLTVGSGGYKLSIPTHLTLLATNEIGLKNLFKIVSLSLTDDLYGVPRVRRHVIETHREGLLVGSSCVNGEVFRAALEKPDAILKKRVAFYDYLEVQPPEVYAHLEMTNGPEQKAYIFEAIQKIIQAGHEQNKIVVATGDVHHLNREDRLYRQIYTKTPAVGGGRHQLNRAEITDIPSMHFRTTDEMLTDFAWLGEALAYEIVVTNTQKIANLCQDIQPIKDKLFEPSDTFMDDRGIPSVKAKLEEMCHEKVREWYGDPLPEYVINRLDKELKSIIGNGFAVIYYISHLLVKKSLDDGYLVGSRGSVGSSFVATLMDITEVNPLSPHYLCPNCHFSSFKMTDEEKKTYGVKAVETALQVILDGCESGFDLPDATCPVCQAKLKKEGHDIPFETFLGFKGDKVPDIDLNFSGEYQAKAHLYCRELFGENYAFRAGTITTVAAKTAFGFVRGFLEEEKKTMRGAEIERLAMNCEGVRRSTGQHPGGIIVVPNYMDIYDVTPIQYPADDRSATWKTTHFDFHSIHDNLLKLDILGHDDPTMIRTLQDSSGIDQKEIPVDDKAVYELFYSTKSLGVTPADIKSEMGTYGVPEFGTFFVRAMLKETKPKTFAELVKISGLSHGTDVWTNNAQDLVNGTLTQFGKVEFKQVIGCRDDIMVYLMYGGLEPALAFEIMEFVRKGLPSKVPEKWAGYVASMREAGIPEWYIWSCGQIKYMFPKAHATAYVLMAVRIAWFKVHKPIHYYAAYFSKRADVFDVGVMIAGADAIAYRIDEINAKGFDATPKEKSLVTVLELALEMTRRGMTFKQPDLYLSEATDFKITADEQSLIVPFGAIDGLGDAVAEKIVEERELKEFSTVMEFKKRTKTNGTILELLMGMAFFGTMEYGSTAALKEQVVAQGQGSLF
ncbi:MAG: PolC-type DNA polymerase III [Defluviitaleaceae bacterium]|nr:PolC-type DNA polymerase III [Defluviitaleaceae bacterium]